MKFALGYRVFVSKNFHNDRQLCATAPTKYRGPINPIQLTCDKPLAGRYLIILRANNIFSGMRNYLVLCEVQVFGHPASYIKTGNTYYYNCTRK